MRGNAVAAPDMQELFEACLVLFGPETSVSEDYLKYLRPSGLKSAYRKIPLKPTRTGPDLGKRTADLNARLQKYPMRIKN